MQSTDFGLSTASNALLSLLKLPQEVENQIYELVLGGNFVHIKRKPSANCVKFAHVVCCATVSKCHLPFCDDATVFLVAFMIFN